MSSKIVEVDLSGLSEVFDDIASQVRGEHYAEAATDVSYAIFHVSDQPRRKIPLRDPFDLSDRVFEDAADTIAEGLAAGDNASDIMAVVADMLVSEVSDKFDQEGPGWAPLAESTLRQRRGGTAQILSDTGRFAGSIRGDSA